MDQPGYTEAVCSFCKGPDAGYQRRKTYAGEGPWLDACEDCARKPYEQPKQFQEAGQ